LPERAAKLYGNLTALVSPNQECTYQQLYERSSGIASLLEQKKIKPHQIVLLLSENNIFFYQAYWAIVQMGAIVAPLNVFLHPKELLHIIADAQAATFIISDHFAQKYTDILKTSGISLITETECSQLSLTNYQAIARDPDKLAALLYTSGTTGFPKGVILSSRNIITNVLQGLVRANCDHRDRIIAVLPLFHSFAQNTCVWGPMMVGGAVIVVPSIERRHIWWGMNQKPTVVAGVPSLFGLFCLLKTVPFDTVRYCVSGGDAMPDKIRSAFALIYRRKIANGYGMTETAPVIAVTADDVMDDTRVVGKLVYDMECIIKDGDNALVNHQEIGVLWVKGPNVMLGYYNAPEATAQMIVDGWLNTGDLALRRADGILLIIGREKDLIAHKGFKIYPQEVENVLLQHADVMQVAVIGIDDEATGQIPIAFIALKKDASATVEDLRNWCTLHLALYKVPRHIIIKQQLPVTATAKVDKKVLKAEYERAT
jgi:long-chain acyl-CoA synthetase